MAKADLHLHTFFSDGLYHPFEVIDKAKERGISIISFTDHDTIDAIEISYPYAKKNDIELIPGVELSAEIDSEEIHILGYFMDCKNKKFTNYLKNFKEKRFLRAKKIIEKLNIYKIDITIDDVIKIAGNSPIGRPHIASALVKKGVVKNIWKAFEDFIGNDAFANVQKNLINYKDAIALLKETGGLSVLAHPGKIEESKLKRLTEAGMNGIEVIHPSHNRMQKKFYNAYVLQNFLLKTGGSDFHGSKLNEGNNLGQFCVKEKDVFKMKEKL